jgi:hypothetical protein
MEFTECKICAKKFYVRPSHKRRGWGKFCSIKCRTKSQFKGKEVNCFLCGKQIYRSPKDLRSSKSGKFFCNKSCQTIWRNKILFSGENHANWKYGKSAYRRILSETNQKKCCRRCNVTDARILVVHHKDHDRENNKVDNLIWLCLNCHFLVHHDKFIELKVLELLSKLN